MDASVSGMTVVPEYHPEIDRHDIPIFQYPANTI